MYMRDICKEGVCVEGGGIKERYIVYVYKWGMYKEWV
jgi:hypothetical protein